ncbi:MAG: peptidase U32 family protein [Solirubrobacterales bacterium]
MNNPKKPELVVPAGSLDKLKAAFAFGADAVYLGGAGFNLRAQATNFTPADMAEGLRIARDYGARIYVTVNAFAHPQDMDLLPAYLAQLAELGVDGLIVSDPGVMMLAAEICPDMHVTVSTQANVTNALSARAYRKLGAQRVVLGRELTLDEIRAVKTESGMEVEVFVHGAMCLSYSGRCWLSLAMTGRDANRGACAHPCRYRYALVEEKRPGQYFPVEEDQYGAYVMNSRDLCLLEQVPALIEAGVDAFKIEGRMKSPLYVAVTTRVYRMAIDSAFSGEPLNLEFMLDELRSVATRPFTTGFLNDSAAAASMDAKRRETRQRMAFVGTVIAYDANLGMNLVEQRAPFPCGGWLTVYEPPGRVHSIQVHRLLNEELHPMDVARHARQHLWVDAGGPLRPGSILAKPEENS